MAIQTDYYKILQVHEDADQEIISAAYKCLSKLYHPDVNKTGSATARMTDINVAYSVIGDERSRKEYHREWLRQKKGKTEQVSALRKNRENRQIEAAAAALDEFFRCMVNADWERAYHCLTAVDKANIPVGDFIKWKNAVSEVYKLGNYQMHYLRRFETCEYGKTVYPEILQFSMNLTEYNRMAEQMEQEQTEKSIALEDGQWKVCLGYTDLKPSIMRFICLAQTLPKVNKDEICRRAIISVDPLTGLLSRSGFLDETEKEVRRNRRYGNPMTLAVITVEPSAELSEAFDDNLSDACVSYVSGKLNAGLRSTDLIGRCEETAFAVLFTETKFSNAELAMKKLMSAFVEDDYLTCRIFWGCSAIEDGDVETAIQKARLAASTQETARAQEEKDVAEAAKEEEQKNTDQNDAKLGKYGLYDILRFNRKWKNHF
jgi:diguanylate cyclase (GGDEF)-like protein